MKIGIVGLLVAVLIARVRSQETVPDAAPANPGAGGATPPKCAPIPTILDDINKFRNAEVGAEGVLPNLKMNALTKSGEDVEKAISACCETDTPKCEHPDYEGFVVEVVDPEKLETEWTAAATAVKEKLEALKAAAPAEGDPDWILLLHQDATDIICVKGAKAATPKESTSTATLHCLKKPVFAGEKYFDTAAACPGDKKDDTHANLCAATAEGAGKEAAPAEAEATTENVEETTELTTPGGESDDRSTSSANRVGVTLVLIFLGMGLQFALN